MKKAAAVFGGGGFIGNAMVSRLKSEGYYVVAADLKQPEFSKSEADEFWVVDLRNYETVKALVYQIDEVYQFAADMGGAGYIFTGEHDADVMHNSASINLNVCNALKGTKTKVFYSSSACMYPQDIQHDASCCGLKESYAYPANPDSEYGWEKLFSERLYKAYARNHGVDIRIARFHNIFGEKGTWNNGKEKFPAAISRKVAEAKDGDKIEVWGTGKQTRSFLYIDECIEGVRILMESDFKEPVNIGSDEMISVNDLAEMVIGISGKDLSVVNVHSTAIGVAARNSDNEMIEEVLGWRPNQPLKTGMEKLYSWIKCQVDGAC